MEASPVVTRIIDQHSREAAETFWCIFAKLTTLLRWFTPRVRSANPACQETSLKDLLTQFRRDSCASEKLYCASESGRAAANTPER